MENWWVELSEQVSPTLEILGFSIHWYGLLIGLGLLTGIWVAEKILGKEKESFWITVLVGGLIGARIYHVLDKWGYYQDHLREIWDLGSGGLGIFGAIIGVVVAVYIYSQKTKRGIFSLTDKLALAAPLAQAIGRWGNFFNMEGFGPPTNLPWKIFIREELRPAQFSSQEFFHPVFMYESILNLALFLILVRVVSKNDVMENKGKLTGIYLMGYGTIRFFLEFLRIDTWIYSDIKVAHIVSIVVFMTGFWLFKQTGGYKLLH